MNKKYRFGALFFLVLVSACSTKKDTFINRNFHSLTTKYNVLHNGKEAYQKGIDNINSKYEDDFFSILPIEPIKFEGKTKIDIPKFSNDFGGGPGAPSIKEEKKPSPSSFERAEEKAVKAIQKHSMNIYGLERNKQIDDAYLLLGKSRYYTERFIPAIDAFNYIVTNYPKASLIDETKIWRAKSNIRIDNEMFAIETLSLLLKKPDLDDRLREEGYTAMAMAYMKMDSVHRVKENLWLATKTDKNKAQTARNLFILGQLYGQENNKDSASLVFNKLINFRRAPYKYRIHANIQLARNSASDSSTVALLKRFDKLIKNRDNRPYLDALYCQVGELEERRDSIERAKKSYKKSIEAKNGSAKQKSYSYEKLADLYFKELDYVSAGIYYDSVVSVAPDKKNLRIRRIERRAKNLGSLIKYENTLYTNDSILRLAKMPEKEREKYFQDYIDKVKKQDEEDAQKKLNKIAFGESFGGGLQSAKKGKWYFYNGQSLSFGKTEFKKVWGNRALEDDWRWSEKSQIKTSAKTDSVSISQSIPKYDVKTYLNTIPSTEKELDSLVFDRNNALFELGLIYKEQFKNPPKAIRYLERLLVSDPDESLILPTNYHLYQLYQNEGKQKAEEYKNVVLTKYPKSLFAKIIINPEQSVKEEKKTDEVSELYTIAYNLYKDTFFEEAVCFIDMTLPTIEESILIPKFELLKAYAIGKYQGKDAYKSALEKVAVGFSQTEQGKQALKILERLKE